VIDHLDDLQSDLVADDLLGHPLVGLHDTDDPDQWETEIGWPIFRSDS
jgi:hypothetical protein